MAMTCPRCGAEYDVTLFAFDRRIRCDCGEWVDLSAGHRQSVSHLSSAGAETEIDGGTALAAADEGQRTKKDEGQRTKDEKKSGTA